jgi:hypothetical protein
VDKEVRLEDSQEGEEMTEVFCKSDCQFASNEDRVCTLKQIQLTQLQKSTPQLACGSYVKAAPVENKYKGIDTERARAAGSETAIRERLG